MDANVLSDNFAKQAHDFSARVAMSGKSSGRTDGVGAGEAAEGARRDQAVLAEGRGTDNGGHGLACAMRHFRDKP
ncbi:hypothetical protein D3C83_184730 [compost metagenome]